MEDYPIQAPHSEDEKQGHRDAKESSWHGVGVGGRFKREETYLYLWLIRVVVWQKPTQYCKVIILQLKKQGIFLGYRVNGTVKAETPGCTDSCDPSPPTSTPSWGIPTLFHKVGLQEIAASFPPSPDSRISGTGNSERYGIF